MNLTKEHLVQAVNAGLALTDPDQDLIDVYRRHGQGLTILRAVLDGMATGQLVLSGAPEPAPPPDFQLPNDPDGALKEGMDPDELKPGGSD